LWRRVDRYDPDHATARIGALLPRWFEAAFTPARRPFPALPLFEYLLAGLTALADWVGSDGNRFPFISQLDETYMAKANERAGAALAAFGLDTGRQRAMRVAPATFPEVSGRTIPNPQQRLVSETSLEAAS